jgi:hypothetical protein
MSRFGPTIWDELIAAGLGGEPLMIEGDEVIVGARFSDDKRSALATVLANHDPNKQKAAVIGPAEAAIQALVDAGLIPANKVDAVLARVRGR